MAKIIFLKNLSIKNFKGIKDLKLNFSKKNNIFGENGTGKTTIFDAFNFLLFSKDSYDRSKFDVQPLDNNNNKIHNLETEIEAVLEVDGKETLLRKIYKENWTKTRGQAERNLKGYTTLYYVNDIPQKEGEYKKYISNLVNENVFKLVTNPMYFSSLPWKDRREILMQIIGDIDSEKVINYNSNLEPLKKLLDDGIDNFLKATKEKINRLKKDRNQIPCRIDELDKYLFDTEHYEKLKKEEELTEEKIKKIDEMIFDRSKILDVLFEKKEELFRLKSELQDKTQHAKLKALEPKQELEKEIMTIKYKISESDREIEQINKAILRLNNSIELNNTNLAQLREEYKKIKQRKFKFDEDFKICQVCGQALPEDSVEKRKKVLEENFNKKNARDLENNKNEGLSVKEQIEKTQKTISERKECIKALEADKQKLISLLKAKEEELKQLDTTGITIEGTKELESKIEEMEEEINSFKAEDVENLKQLKKDLVIKLQDLNTNIELSDRSKERIEELELKEKELSSNIALLEGKQILGEEFIRTKVELLEDTVNHKFKFVKFKLFNNLTNGGLEECCEPTVNGVPFTSNLNTAAKINAGIDIINTLSEFYNVQAPIFVDNAESINKIIETNSQLINLIVSLDKVIKVEQ